MLATTQMADARRFLIVDDQAFIRAMVRGMLVRLEAKDIVEAANGHQARQILGKAGSAIDCIICDWSMQPVGGLELLRQVRAGAIDGVARSTCFIMLTGHGGEQIVKAAIALDVNAYLVKPVSFEQLARTIGNAMAQRLVLKEPAAYGAVAEFGIPAAVRHAETTPAPWLQGMARPSRRSELDIQLAQIRSDTKLADAIRNTRRALLDDVKPGLVLAEDLFADRDAMVAAAGTVISPALLAQLKVFAADADDAAYLWIADPATDTGASP